MRRKLQDVFETKVWPSSAKGTRSGPGSTLKATERVRAALPDVLKRYKVKTFFDAPCGDFYWMREVDLGKRTYIGGDISSEIIADVTEQYASDKVSFVHIDITSDPLPKADMMMCRDCLFHLKDRFKWGFLRNFAEGPIPYLMMTMHHFDQNNHLSDTGNFQPFSPMAAPFNFPAPIEMVHETVDELPDDVANAPDARQIKSLGIWKRKDVKAVVEAQG
ncbi:class I SAM-dependent methyltransferase [Hasllibacter sp. MH4015]|uniref:class I SAM-dependent methyltransferase n=1 Tax=Hasllibacter sp. MH4015 TaxID=2854029 RepID=UPI001CD58163|nr:class I SAM-dependent methyltransferase [Hasllibacter sp. MH4015]